MSSMKIWSMIFAGRGADVAVSCKKNLSPFVIALGAQIAAVPATLAQSELGKVTSRVEGVVMVARSYDISTEVRNKINRLRFVQGQFVKHGDLLVEFDTGFKKLEVELAEAEPVRAAAQIRNPKLTRGL